MEQLLLKLARQLDSLDEASLMSLWDSYANKVNRFEPTQRWEEAALVFSLIQAKKWKNQLFNYQWAAQVRPQDVDKPSSPRFSLEKLSLSPKEEPVKIRAAKLDFVPKKNKTKK